MTSGANGEWVRQGTPRDDSADWDEEQSEYGTAISPTEWDDYSSEQSVPVAPPRSQAAGGIPTAGTPDSPAEYEQEAPPGQEPDAAPEYRSDDAPTYPDGEPGTDPDRDGAPLPDEDEAHGHPESPAPGSEGDHQSPEDADQSEFVAGHVPAAETDSDSARPDEPSPEYDVEEVVFEEDVADPELDDPAEGPLVVDEDIESVVEDSDAQSTQHLDTSDGTDDDTEATRAVPVVATGAAADPGPETTGAVPAGLYRSQATEETAVIAADPHNGQDVDVEEERLQARLEAERLAREQRLGTVPTSSDNATREDAGPPRVTTDKFLPSLGLFVLRIVTAGVLGVASYQILGSGVDQTADFLGGYPLIPEPRLVAWILGFTLGAMALLLIIGLLQRVVGFLLLAIAVCSLIFIRWGDFSIFNAQVEGFIGDRDLLLAAVGLVLLSIGGGAWGIDGAFRRARAESKAERQG